MSSRKKLYTVERLLKYRGTSQEKRKEVLVKWQGYKRPTWEPASHVSHLDEYQPPWSLPKYSANATIKASINEDLATRALPLQVKRALILDTPLFRTAKQLTNAGFLPSDIHIPNYTLEAYEDMKVSPFQVYPCSIGSLLPQLPKETPFSLVWMDYCGRYEGGLDCRPVEDIQLLFHHLKLAPLTLLAFTFNTRGHTGPRGGALLKPLQEIPGMAQEAGYSLHLLDVRVYHPMFYLLFQCEPLRR